MKKKGIICLAAAMAAAFFASFTVMAADGSGSTAPAAETRAETDAAGAVIDNSRTGHLSIRYFDDADGTSPVSGAGFTLYKVADYDNYGGYVPVLDGVSVDSKTTADGILSAVETAYKTNVKGGASFTLTTGSDGTGTVSIPSDDFGEYLVVETAPAADHLASEPFLCGVPETEDGAGWNYDVTTNPKSRPTGDLKVTKTVQGNGGDATRAFHFKVTFDASGSYAWTSTNGASGTLKSGDTVTAKSGETVTVRMLPAGTKYTVAETEANQGGYTTTATGTAGTIVYKNPQTAAFVNTRTLTPTPKTPTTTTTNTPPTSSRHMTNVKTGDTMNPALYAVLAVAAAVAGAAIALAGKNKGKNKNNKKKGEEKK